MIAALFAVDQKGGMGNDGGMPWPQNKEDMMWFKQTTQGQIVVMGRKTWESSDMPKPLPGRTNVVLTRNFLDRSDIIQANGDVCESLDYLKKQNPKKDIFVIGGENLLVQAKPIIERAYITKISGEYICDTVIDLDNFLQGFKLVNVKDLGTCKVEEYERI